MKPVISIAIETSCSRGGLALGAGDGLVGTVDFDAGRRHAAQVISRLAELVETAGLAPTDLREVYVSVGPGSFTGVRVGVTVARTLAQALAGVRCVAVPTAAAVAENARDLPFDHLGVVLDAREDQVYFALFARLRGRLVAASPARVLSTHELLRQMPRGILLIGQALEHLALGTAGQTRSGQDLQADGVQIASPHDPALHLPTAASVWRVGRRMAQDGRYTPYPQLLPIYPREPEAVRLWDQRARQGG